MQQGPAIGKQDERAPAQEKQQPEAATQPQPDLVPRSELEAAEAKWEAEKREVVRELQENKELLADSTSKCNFLEGALQESRLQVAQLSKLLVAQERTAPKVRLPG